MYCGEFFHKEESFLMKFLMFTNLYDLAFNYADRTIDRKLLDKEVFTQPNADF